MIPSREGPLVVSTEGSLVGVVAAGGTGLMSAVDEAVAALSALPVQPVRSSPAATQISDFRIPSTYRTEALPAW